MLLMPLITSDLLMGGGVTGSGSGLQKSLGFIKYIFELIGISEVKDMAILVVVFMIFKHICIITLNFFQFKVIFGNDIWLRNKLLEKYLYFDFLNFSKLRSSELIRNTAEQVGQISYGSLLSLLTIISEAIVVLVLLGLVFYTIPLFSAILIIIVFMLGLLPFYVFKRRMIILGKIRFQSIARTISEIQNIYSLYVEIKLYKLKGYFLNRVKKQSVIFSNAQVQNNVITNIPKGIIEIAAVAVILILVVSTKGSREFLPTIGIIVTSIFRITPSFTRISSALTQYKFSIEQINVLSDVLLFKGSSFPSETVPVKGKPEFNKSVSLENVYFAYDKENVLFSDLSIEIPKGSFILLKGQSGKGKSTVIKILMGLIKPDRGRVLLDNKDLSEFDPEEWFSKIGYVPQRPIIIEGTLIENICLGIPEEELSPERYNRVIENAQLTEVRDMMKNAILSEEGGSISGGQAQRIGIARALYRNPEILFLDEPTSALDYKNAQMIISLLNRLSHDLNYTIILISHSNEFDEYASSVIEF